MRGPISRLAASTAEAREERRDGSEATFVELDDLEGRSVPALRRIRTRRIVRLALSVAAVPAGWILAFHLTGLLPVVALAGCMGGAVNALLSIYLIVHVHGAIKATLYEESFTDP